MRNSGMAQAKRYTFFISQVHIEISCSAKL